MLFRAVTVALCVALCAGNALAAEAKKPAAEGAGGDPVIARVNGTELHRSDLMTALRSLPPQAQSQPMDKLYPAVMNELVAQTLLTQAAKKQRLENDPEVKKELAHIQDQVLAQAYAERLVRKDATNDKLKARYDKYVKDAPAREEVKARHILLPTEAEAKDVIAQLDKGADFSKLAAEKTTDPTGKNSGGDLGWFTKDQMVPEFADAAFKLKKGEITQTPVHTQFGWHVIKLEDRRPAQPPSFDQLKPQLMQAVGHEIIEAKLKELSASAKIEVFNPDGSKPVAPAPTAQGPAPAPSGAPAPGVPTLAPETAPSAMSPAAPPTLAPATKGKE